MVNYYAILGCAILSMIVGFTWYGPLFGKKWMEIIGADMTNKAQMEEGMKKAIPLYGIQFLLSLFQIYVLAGLIAWYPSVSGLTISLWIYAGFILPTTAGSAMWSNGPRSTSAWSRFLIQAGAQLVNAILFGIILGIYR